MDVHSKEQRRKNMSAIRTANTKPEMLVRKFLFSKGYRYRLNYSALPGKPDIVLRKYRTCIFVNGCFWHGHEGCKYYVVPKTNTDFWTDKIGSNIRRDREVRRKLTQMGWYCITIWGCQLKSDKRAQTLMSLDYMLNHIFLTIHSVIRPTNQENAVQFKQDYNKSNKTDTHDA